VSKIDNQKVTAHLQNKWGSRACPMCGKGPWNVQDSTYQITEYHEEGFVVGGPVIPVIPVICGNCGYTILVNAILAGLMERSAPPKKEEPR
jgi:ribosomal protein S27AE